MSAPMQPISLGQACEVKYQIVRRFGGGGSALEAVQVELDRPRRLGRHIFDWQITPIEAVCEYLERNFEGVYERADLTVSDDGSEALHRWLHTRHPHDFHPDGPLSDAAIDAEYETARAKFDYLADKFRAHLLEPGPFLYILNAIPTQTQARRLLAALGARSAEHRFQVLVTGLEDIDASLDIEGVTLARLPRDSGKPAASAWQGNDAAWDAIFDRFDLTPPS